MCSVCCQYCKYSKKKGEWYKCRNKNSGFYGEGRSAGAWCFEFEEEEENAKI